MNCGVLDIPDKKLAQQNLPLYQFSIEHAADAIYWIASDARVMYANNQAVRSLGYPREELLQMRVFDFDPLYPRENWEQTWQHLRESGLLAVESIHRRRDGSEFPVWVHASYYRDDEKELSFACCRDISEKRAAEQALRAAKEELEARVGERTAELAASDARYQDLYHNAPDMFASIDADSGRIVQCNQTLSRSTGYEAAELVGRPISELYDPACLEDARRAWAALESAGEVGSCDMRLCCKDGRVIDVSVTMSAVRGPDGKIVQRRSIFRDVTDYRRAQQQVEQHRHELAHVARLATTGEMAAGLAHELNQPLYAVSNFAQGALRRLEAGSLDRDSLCGVLQDISHESQRAAEIIRSLRRYIAKRAPQRAAIDVNDLIQAVFRLVAAEADRRQCAVDLKLGEALPPIRCDATQIKQVLVNLVLNGIEAMSELSPLERRIVISSAGNSPGAVRLSVSDSGPGFPSSDADRVFDAFYTTKQEGIGLGLTISKSIVESHGGRLMVAPNPVRGVTFAFDLPVLRGDL